MMYYLVVYLYKCC